MTHSTAPRKDSHVTSHPRSSPWPSWRHPTQPSPAPPVQNRPHPRSGSLENRPSRARIPDRHHCHGQSLPATRARTAGAPAPHAPPETITATTTTADGGTRAATPVRPPSRACGSGSPTKKTPATATDAGVAPHPPAEPVSPPASATATTASGTASWPHRGIRPHRTSARPRELCHARPLVVVSPAPGRLVRPDSAARRPRPPLAPEPFRGGFASRRRGRLCGWGRLALGVIGGTPPSLRVTSVPGHAPKAAGEEGGARLVAFVGCPCSRRPREPASPGRWQRRADTGGSAPSPPAISAHIPAYTYCGMLVNILQ